MALTTVGRVAVSLAGATGISSAVGVPMILKNKGYVGQSFVNISRNISKVDISHCDNPLKSDKTEVDFGSQQIEGVCGNLEAESQTLQKAEVFTSFLRERGDEQDQDGKSSENQNQGTAQCDGAEYHSRGLVFVDNSDSTGVQYLGKCGSSTLENTPFVKKNKKSESNAEKITLEYCDKNCGKPNSETLIDNQRSLQKGGKQSGNGKTVKFYSTKTQTEEGLN